MFTIELSKLFCEKIFQCYALSTFPFCPVNFSHGKDLLFFFSTDPLWHIFDFQTMLGDLVRRNLFQAFQTILGVTGRPTSRNRFIKLSLPQSITGIEAGLRPQNWKDLARRWALSSRINHKTDFQQNSSVGSPGVIHSLCLLSLSRYPGFPKIPQNP